MKLKPSTLTKIIELREKFTPISNISYLFSKLNKDYPIDFITEEQAQELIQEYHKLLDRIKNLNLKYENKDNQDKNLAR